MLFHRPAFFLFGTLLCCSSQSPRGIENMELSPPQQSSRANKTQPAWAVPFPGEGFGCRNPYPQPWLCENFQVDGVDQGSYLWIQRPHAQFLLVAPHGRFDKGTDVIAYNIFPPQPGEGQPAWSQLIAHSFRRHSPSGLQHNVNRPSTLHQDVCTDPPELKVSQLVYQRLTEHLDAMVPKPKLYFEIHGQDDPELKATIEVATARLSAGEAAQVREIMMQELDRAGIPGIAVKIEGLDEVKFRAGKAKLCGSIHHVAPAPALHTEIPLSMRQGEEAQVKSVQFYQALLRRLATELFPL